MRWERYVVAAVALAAILFFLPGRAEIAPQIQADNNYLFLAADRMYAGLGPTTPVPRPRFLPWEWQSDWSYLTRWPMGYPALLCLVRYVFGMPTIWAAQCIAVVACAVALVAWFTWLRRALPGGVAAALLALVAAGSAVSVHALINPATDTILVAGLPLVLLLTAHGLTVGSAGRTIRLNDPPQKVAGCVPDAASPSAGASDDAPCGWMFLAGLTAGLLFWFRYAAVFVAFGVGMFLVSEWLIQRRLSFRHVAAFAVGSLLPITSLLVITKAMGSSGTLQEDLHLGKTMGLELNPAYVATAWWKLTDLPFYDYHWYSHWFFAAVAPFGVAVMACLTSSWRRAYGRFAISQPVLLSGAVLLAFLATIITATVLFSSKADYVNIERYYEPIRPLYFLLFIAPVVCIPRRSVRALACVPLLMACSWYLRQEWPGTYRRWLAADRPFTDYGRWAVCFEPGGNTLYAWLQRQQEPRLIVLSNFPDEIALETWIPACPLPEDESQLEEWVGRIRASRGIKDARVLFVLDPSNHTRHYFLPKPDRVVAQFGLVHCRDALPSIRRYVYEYHPRPPDLEFGSATLRQGR